MTNHFDAARGRENVARWCTLAEQRLEYLTELFETGRWRRFHSEMSFLENIQEAKAAVQVWRYLAREPSPDAKNMERPWVAHASAPMPEQPEISGNALAQFAQTKIPAEPMPQPSLMIPEPASLPQFDVLFAPAEDEHSKVMPAVASIIERYPLLRNAL
jgi:uncharacterized repeat protein (TIGR03809 family)